MIIGFGSTLQDPRDEVWLRTLMEYLGTGPTGIDFCFWVWNPQSWDTDGILNKDWTTVNSTHESHAAGQPIHPDAGPGGVEPIGMRLIDSTPPGAPPGQRALRTFMDLLSGSREQDALRGSASRANGLMSRKTEPRLAASSTGLRTRSHFGEPRSAT